MKEMQKHWIETVEGTRIHSLAKKNTSVYCGRRTQAGSNFRETLGTRLRWPWVWHVRKEWLLAVSLDLSQNLTSSALVRRVLLFYKPRTSRNGMHVCVREYF